MIQIDMPMDDLISRAALLERFVWECSGECCGCEHEKKEKPYYCKLIKSAPAVDAVPVRHGMWIYFNCAGNEIYQCSECFHWIDVKIDRNYCPNCGAKMENNNE